MKRLSKQDLPGIQPAKGLDIPGTPLFELPEKVLQFGTGVLLRGLPDYYVDKANKQGVFNGRIVVVKSTAQGGTDAFAAQDGLYTHCIRGVLNGHKVEKDIINASISRVLSAAGQWQQVLECADNPELTIVFSNTTEVGIVLDKDDKINQNPPASFPGKLLAILHRRYQTFKGDESKGLVMVPTELIVGNGEKLESIVLELAHLNGLEPAFMDWLETANHFCNSLVDRIVPGKLPSADKDAVVEKYGYDDDLMIMSEPYGLWAIEAKKPAVAGALSFATVDNGVVLAPNIEKFRELKLRLLNATHTLSSGTAFLAGFTTVKQAMDDAAMSAFAQRVMLDEIAPAITGGDISSSEAIAFANGVLDRFGNPFIEHRWISITAQYSGKMKMRVLPLLLKHYQQHNTVPQLMALGFAAYIAFMQGQRHDDTYTGQLNGQSYVITDERAAWFAGKAGLPPAAMVKAVLGDEQFWESDLTQLAGFEQKVAELYNDVNCGGIHKLLSDLVAPKKQAVSAG